MLLAALPATPVQTAHACYRYGFEIVVPASWGDELVAHAILEDLRDRDREPVIQCTCPLVAGRLLANGEHLLDSMVQTAPPPIAAARYARRVFSPRSVHITYIGACPGANDSEIDQRFVPDEFLRMLDEHDISLADMPTVFDSVLPPDRRRFASLPGGCPSQEALWQASDGRMLREVTQPTFSTDLAQTLLWREYVMIDVAPSLGCACAGSYSRVGTRYGRVAVMALEPPRASQPVVAHQPEFTGLDPRPATTAESGPHQHNGRQPHERMPEEEVEAPIFTEPQAAAGIAGAMPRAVHVRTPTSSLPRAYLAKRRHLVTAPREPAQAELFAGEPLGSRQNAEAAPISEREPLRPDSEQYSRYEPKTREQPAEPSSSELPLRDWAAEASLLEPTIRDRPVEPLSPEPTSPGVLPNDESVDWFHPADIPETVVEAAAVVAPGLGAPTEGPGFPVGGPGDAPEAVASPNEGPDAGRPIAVHVEPAPAAPEKDEPPHAGEAAAPHAMDSQREIDLGPSAVAVGLEDEPAATSEPGATQERHPWERPRFVGESPPATASAASGPLRVEVIIEQDSEPAPEVITPDAVHGPALRSVSHVGEELVARAKRPWSDVLIALWLVLVASAVIAALVWRR